MKAQVFIPLLIAALFAFGFFIGWLSRRLGGRLAPRRHNIITGVIIGAILLGIVGMFQPWNIELYRLGFKFVLVGTLAFTAWSHVRSGVAAAAPVHTVTHHGG